MSDLERQPDLAQRRFLKRLAGTAAGVAGFAAVSGLLNPSGVNPRNGIVLQGGDYCTVQGNVIRDMNSGVWLLSGSDNNIVLGNLGFNCGATVTNAGAGNLVVNNL